MPALPLIDLSNIDLRRDVVPLAEIRALIPHRHEFALLDGIVHFDPVTLDAVGYHDARADGFWVRGHIPGDPIFPGALMVEAAAQLSSYCFRKWFGTENGRFFGFAGIDKVKFRSMARPGDRLYVLCKQITLNKKMSRFAVQGVIGDRIAFDGEIIGAQMVVKTTDAAAP